MTVQADLPSNRSSGFTIVELLVVMAVVGVLVSISIPAVQSAREAARRTQCRNHLKQIGIALHSYHESHAALPPGTISRFHKAEEAFDTIISSGGFYSISNSSPETPWMFHVLPQLELRAEAKRFDWNVGTFGHVDLRPPWYVSGINRNADVMSRGYPVFQCPSDRDTEFEYDVGALLSLSAPLPALSARRSNYVANWGNTNWQQDADLNGDGIPEWNVTFLESPFSRGRSIRFRHVTDGLDNTVFLAEVVKGTGVDARGAGVLSLPGGSLYMSRFPPNSTRDLFGVLPKTGPGSGDQMPFPATCQPAPRLPCSFQPVPKLSVAGAKSSHSGGVFVLVGSGRVSFVSDSIDHDVWLGIHGISDGMVSVFGQ